MVSNYINFILLGYFACIKRIHIPLLRVIHGLHPNRRGRTDLQCNSKLLYLIENKQYIQQKFSCKCYYKQQLSIEPPFLSTIVLQHTSTQGVQLESAIAEFKLIEAFLSPYMKHQRVPFNTTQIKTYKLFRYILFHLVPFPPILSRPVPSYPIMFLPACFIPFRPISSHPVPSHFPGFRKISLYYYYC